MAGLTSLAALEGKWALSRRIAHDAGGEDTFEGAVTFSRSGPRLIQDEEGWFVPAGTQAPLRATRRYIWTQSGDQFDVMFDDMRPFHRFPASEDAPTATHLCAPDRYEVSYDFSDFPRWTSVWWVEGPRKAYRMTNRFTRQDG